MEEKSWRRFWFHYFHGFFILNDTLHATTSGGIKIKMKKHLECVGDWSFVEHPKGVRSFTEFGLNLQNTFSSIRDFWEHQRGEWRETSKQNCISMWRNIYLVVDKTWTPQKICFRHHIKYFSIISTEPSSFWFTSCLTGLWLKLRIRPSTDFYWREVRIISEAAT